MFAPQFVLLVLVRLCVARPSGIDREFGFGAHPAIVAPRYPRYGRAEAIRGSDDSDDPAGHRTRHTAGDKIRIVLEGLHGVTGRREGIATNRHSSGSKELPDDGKQRLLRAEDDQVKHRAAELSFKNRVLKMGLRGPE